MYIQNIVHVVSFPEEPGNEIMYANITRFLTSGMVQKHEAHHIQWEHYRVYTILQYDMPVCRT